MKKRIIITGADGQMGHCLRSVADNYPELDFYFLGKGDCDICQRESVGKAFRSIDPDYVINAAAYTAVDQAENEKEKAFAVNAYALQNIAHAPGSAKCVHLSTDYVYYGNKNIPINEEATVRPLNNYAASKLLGEQILMNSSVPSLIIRSSWIYSEFGNNFVRTMLSLAKKKESLNVVNDQRGSPTYGVDLARAILDIISMDINAMITLRKWKSVYNFSNSGETSWYTFALNVFAIAQINININPVSSALYPTPAARPEWSVLDCSRIKAAFGLEIKDWKESLCNCIEKLVN